MKRRLPLRVLLALGYIGLNLVAAIFAPFLAPYAPTDIVGAPWASPSPEYWLGLDNLGRDLLSRLIYGAANSIGIALLVTLLSFSIGIIAGFWAGIKGGLLDLLLSRFFELFLAMPTLIFILMILAVFGTSVPVLVVTLGFIDSTRVFRLSRLLAQQIFAKEYIEAARLRGEGFFWMIFREIGPNALGALLVEFGLRFAFVLLLMAALSYLGLGIQPPAADWGNMIRDNALVISLGGWAALYPALAIAILAGAIHVVVDLWDGQKESQTP